MRYESKLIEMARALGFEKQARKPSALLSDSSFNDDNLKFDNAYRKKRRIKNRMARESRRRNRK